MITTLTEHRSHKYKRKGKRSFGEPPDQCPTMALIDKRGQLS